MANNPYDNAPSSNVNQVEAHIRMAVVLWNINGFQCAMNFVKQLKTAEQQTQPDTASQ